MVLVRGVMRSLIPTWICWWWKGGAFSPQRRRSKEAARLYMALRGLAVSKDILLYSRDEFDHWKNSLNHVVGRAHREGRVLYGRP